jgi:hypothetical protein
VSELERVGRLPVFVDEEQWSRAFHAARDEVSVLEGQGLLLPQTRESRTLIAHRIATAALRAAAQVDEGDIGELPGVTVSHVDEIANHTDTVTPPIAPPYWQDMMTD